MSIIKSHLQLAYGYRAEAVRAAPLTPEDEEFEVIFHACSPTSSFESFRSLFGNRNAEHWLCAALADGASSERQRQDGERSIRDYLILAARAQGGGSVELGKAKIGDFTMEFLYSPHDDGSGAGNFRTEVAGPDE